MREEVQKLSDAIKQSKSMIAVTGAGISLPAGGVTMSGLLTKGGMGFLSSNPQSVYKAFRRVFYKSMFENGPTITHKALAQLEADGILKGIITTNVDCLHTIAGSKNVAEIEGSYNINVCKSCGQTTYGYEIWNQGKPPICPHCGGTLVSHDVYSHAAAIPEEVEKARLWASKADLVLIMGFNGSYAQTYWSSLSKDGRIIQINPSRTQFDSMAELNIRMKSDDVFQEMNDSATLV